MFLPRQITAHYYMNSQLMSQKLDRVARFGLKVGQITLKMGQTKTLAIQNVLKPDLKQSRICLFSEFQIRVSLLILCTCWCAHLGPIWPTFGLNLTFLTTETLPTRDGRFGSKVSQISPKWDKSGTSSNQISVHLARSEKVPFGANLIHFGAKPTIPAPNAR